MITTLVKVLLHLPLDCASDLLKQISQAVRLIQSTTQIWVVTRH